MLRLRAPLSGQAITSVDEWLQYAPPKQNDRHWRDGRSAMALAKACLGNGVSELPVELRDLLRPLGVTSGEFEGTPEARIPIDNLAGEPANVDLAVLLPSDAGVTALAVEAKADEPFGRTVGAVLRAGAERIAADEATNSVTRVQGLTALLLPPWREGLPHLGELRYQLLTGTAAAVGLAREHGACRAVFVVYELINKRHTTEPRQKRNRCDLDAFVKRLSDGAVEEVPRGELVGPFRIDGGEVVEVWLGKVRRELVDEGE